MKCDLILRHEFVEHIPPVLEDRTVYVSVAYATVVHRCCCGCGREVVTPLSPTDWALRFDGETVSLDPSIGNWSFECRSHYWIRRNAVRWAGRWSDAQVVAGRARDLRAKAQYYAHAEPAGAAQHPARGSASRANVIIRWWRRLRRTTTTSA